MLGNSTGRVFDLNCNEVLNKTKTLGDSPIHNV